MKKLKDLTLENVDVSKLMTAEQMDEVRGGNESEWCTDGMCTNHLCTGGWCTDGMCNTSAWCLL